MLWIALHLPRLALEAWPSLASSAEPAVVFHGQQVVLPNEAAALRGVEPGMGLSTARSRCPELQVRLREPAQEQALLEQLALVALRYTPRVVLLPQGLALEVESSLRLFRGELALWDRLAADLAPWNLRVGLSAAPTREGALLLARLPRPIRTRRLDRLHLALDALPLPLVLQAWDAPEPLQSLLHGLGAHRLGALRRLPRQGLQQRGAAAVLLQLDRAYGAEPEPAALHEPAEMFRSVLELPEATENIDRILPAVQGLMAALDGWLSARHRVAQGLELRLIHDSPRRQRHPDTPLNCHLSAPESDAQALFSLFREQLTRQVLPAPVRSLSLELVAHTERSSRSPSFKWAHTVAENTDEKGLQRLQDRLRARLGEARVLVLHTQDDHRPERASAWTPTAQPLPRPSSTTGMPAPPPLPRPCWLLPSPQPLVERQGRLWQGAVGFELRSGPERIEAGWFDDDPTCRDYHVAQSSDRRLAWVYRHTRAEGSAWFLHGWFG